MRLALISDIHGNLPALEAVAADIRRRGVDQVVNLGDSLSGPLLPLETAQYLMAAGWPTLAGNHERQLLSGTPDSLIPSDRFALAQLDASAMTWLGSLQPVLQWNQEVFLCHGTPTSDVVYFLDTAIPGGTRPASADEIEARLSGQTSRLIACGHTHLARAVRSRAGQLLVNPGSVGLPAYDDIHPVTHVVETGSPDARYAIVERRSQDWSAELISVPYDHCAMSRKARREGRSDWAHALQTGYMAITAD